jgi:hypothetical protein
MAWSSEQRSDGNEQSWESIGAFETMVSTAMVHRQSIGACFVLVSAEFFSFRAHR